MKTANFNGICLRLLRRTALRIIKKIRYSNSDDHREMPAWINGVLKKVVNLNSDKRYAELSEFVFDLRHPNQEFLKKSRPTLMDHNPLMFWKGVSFALAVIVVLLLSPCHK